MTTVTTQDTGNHVEQWKSIQDCPDYAVSNLGRVKRIVTWRHRRAGTLITPNLANKGYAQVSLSGKNGRITRKIHRLVMDAFCGTDHRGINHINGIKSDNRLDNLEYATAFDNNMHAVKIGLRPLHTPGFVGIGGSKGEINGNHVITATDVSDIRTRKKNGETVTSIATRFGISKSTVWQICQRRTWKHIE